MTKRTRSHCLIRKSVLLLFIASLAGNAAGQGLRPCTGRKVPQLIDITKSTGIDFVHTSAPEKKYIVESMSGGVVLIDYDRDGLVDIYFTNAPTVEMSLKGERARSALYRNTGALRFVEVTEKAGVAYPCFAMGGAVGDVDNDGWPDIYVTCLGANVLYRNNGKGSFTDIARKAGVADERWSAGAAFGDYNGDGHLDLFVANYVDFKLDDLPGFGSSPTCRYRGIDVQCGPRGLKGAGDALFRANGDGTFTNVNSSAKTNDPDGYYGLGVVWSDYGRLGRPDVFVANDSTPNFFYVNNNGKDLFEERGLESGTAVSADGAEQGCMGIAVGDYLHNGRMSIFVTNFADEYNTLYRNEGGYDFNDVSFFANVAQSSRPYVGWGTGFFDIDNDTWLDLFVVNGHVYPQIDTLPSGARYRQPKLLHINTGGGKFCDAGRAAGDALLEPRVSRGAAFGDLDNDGDIDIVIGELDGAPMILENKGNTENHWATFTLEAKKGSPLAIGARIVLEAGGVAQTEEIRSGGSYLSQNDLRVHFGLGKARRIDKVTITWPSGSETELKDLAADRFYTVREGKGTVATRQGRKRSRGR